MQLCAAMAQRRFILQRWQQVLVQEMSLLPRRLPLLLLQTVRFTVEQPQFLQILIQKLIILIQKAFWKRLRAKQRQW